MLPSKSVEGLQGQQVQTSGNKVLKGEVVSIASGTTAAGNVDRALSSATNRVGDRGYFTLNQNLNGIPAGSRIEFTVTQVESARRGFDKPGSMQLKAVSLTTPDGKSSPLNGNVYIVEDAKRTNLVGNTTGKRVATTAGKTLLGAGIGAALGTATAAATGGGLGRGAWMGAAIGGAGGAVGAGLSKGQDVDIRSGSKLILKFTQKVDVTVN